MAEVYLRFPPYFVFVGALAMVLAAARLGVDVVRTRIAAVPIVEGRRTRS